MKNNNLDLITGLSAMLGAFIGAIIKGFKAGLKG